MNPRRVSVVPAKAPYETVLLVLTLLALAGALAAFEPSGQVNANPDAVVHEISEKGDTAKQAVLGFVYIANLLLLIRFRPRAWSFVGVPLMALVVWAFASVTWSVIPDGTVRRAAALTGTIVVGLYAGLRCDERRLSALLCIAAALTVVGSLVWALAFPTLGFDTDGDMRGLFYHKNAFGLFLALSITAVLYRIFGLNDYRRRNIALLAGLLICFFLSHSATPIVGAMAAVVAMALAALLQRSEGRMQSTIPWVIAAVAALMVLTGANLGTVVATVLGRDASFSGRTSIWDFVLPMIMKRPWFGYGYGIFWLGESSPGALFWYWAKQYELHAHNGYLQLLLDLGVAGLAMFVTILGVLAARTVQLSRNGAASLVLWIAAFLAYFLVTNCADTQLLESNSLLTALFVWAIVRVNLAAWRLTYAKQASYDLQMAQSFKQLVSQPVAVAGSIGSAR